MSVTLDKATYNVHSFVSVEKLIFDLYLVFKAN